jgi:hypothetical protein
MIDFDSNSEVEHNRKLVGVETRVSFCFLA